VPLAIIEDPTPQDGEKHPEGRVFLGNDRGLKSYTWSSLDAEAQEQLTKVREALRRDAALAMQVRAAQGDQGGSRERFDALTRLERKLKRRASSRADLTQAVNDLVERL